MRMQPLRPFSLTFRDFAVLVLYMLFFLIVALVLLLKGSGHG
jgi:hypothetical protein